MMDTHEGAGAVRSVCRLEGRIYDSRCFDGCRAGQREDAAVSSGGFSVDGMAGEIFRGIYEPAAG